MSTGKIDDLVSDAALERLDTLLTKLGITRDAMASATEQAAKLNSALGDTRSMQEFQAANEKAAAATQTVISANNTIISQQKELTTQTQAVVEATKAKLLTDAETGKVLIQINGTTEANIKLLIDQKIQLQAVNDALKNHTKEVVSSSASQAAHAQKTVELTKRQVELKESTAQLALLIKQQTKEQLAAVSSNDAQIAKLNQLRKAYNSLSEEEVKNIAVGGALITEIEALSVATSTANEKQGKFNDSVGKYQNAGASVGKAIGNMLTPLRQLAYILPGIGLAGLFNMAFDWIGKTVEELGLFNKKLTDTQLAAQKVNDALASKSYTTAIENIQSLKNNIDLAKQGFISKDGVVKEYNETLGKTTGFVHNLDEAEKALTKNADAYIRFTLLKAVANLALEEAAKKAYEAEQTRIKKAQEFEKPLDRGNLFGITSDADSKRALAQIKKNEEARKNEQIKASEDAKNAQLNIAKDFNRQAAELAKKFGFNFFGNTGSGDGGTAQNNDELELAKAKLREQQAIAKNILDDEKQSYQARLAALAIYVKRSNDLIDNEQEIANRAPNISGTQRQTNAVNARSAKTGVSTFNINQQEKIQQEINDRVTAEQKKLLDSYIASEKAIEDVIQNSLNDQLLELDLTNSDKILKITKAYSQGLISEKNYNNQVNKLRKDAAAEGVDIQIKALEQIAEAQAAAIALGFGSGKDLQATGNKITGLKIQRNNLKTGALGDSAKGDKLSEKEKAQEILAFSDQAIKALDIVQGLIDANAKAKIDALEQEFVLIQQNGEAEKTRVDNSLLSSKEKARQNSIIDAQTAQQRARITQQENEIKKKQAEFDKAASIAKIIQQTAVAVVSALTIPVFGVALAAVIGALGAAQLAVAIATPLPQFEKGGTVKKDGHIITGEAGTELRIDPSGKTSFTADHANVTYAQAGTKIINNKDLVKMLGKPEQVQYIVNATNDNKRVEKLLEQNNELQRRSKRPVVNVFNDKFGSTYAKRNY